MLFLHRFLPVIMSLILSMVGSGAIQPLARIQAAPVLPNMSVTSRVDSNYYTSLAYIDTELTFQTEVHNTGNVPLGIVANLTPPSDWDVNNQSDDCPDDLAPGNICTLTWVFTPHVSRQVTVNYYVHGFYTDSYGNTRSITISPAFLFSVLPPI